MAVSTDGSVYIAAYQSLLVNRIKGLVILRCVALLTTSIELEGKIPQTLRSQGRMGKTGDILVTICAV